MPPKAPPSDRGLHQHWIDAAGDPADTRHEVLMGKCLADFFSSEPKPHGNKKIARDQPAAILNWGIIHQSLCYE